VHRRQPGRVGGGERADVRVVRLGNDEDVGGRDRVQVAEGERELVLADHGRRDLAGHDSAEEAVVGHGPRS
jgi:hypothetical protein